MELYAQDTLNLILRDKDINNFQEIKLFLNIVNNKGESVSNLDSTNIFVNEINTGKKVNPKVEKFMNSSESISLCFVIDASNSMNGAPLNNIKEGLLSVLPDLRPQDKIGIAYFNDEFYKKVDFTSDKDVLKNNIKDLSTGGKSSQIYPSIKAAVDWLSGNNSSRKILVILSDGIDNSDMKIEEVFNVIKDKSFSIFSIGTIADNSNSRRHLKNMEDISSKANDGFYFRISTPEDMKNIIPLIYDRIKNEYILTYYSYCPVSTQVNGNIEIKRQNTTFVTDFSYKSPDKIIKNAPAPSFFETKEFLFGSIGVGVILIALGTFLYLNIQKKKQFKFEKEEEQRLRQLETEENMQRFEAIQKEYDELLDRLENQQNISQQEKERIFNLENLLQESSKTVYGEPAKIDIRRRTMILEAKNDVPKISGLSNGASLTINSGIYSGQMINLIKNNTSIGRQDCDIVLKDDTISRSHASIINSNGEYYIQDLNSTNGTFVNNQRISQTPLTDGDNIRLGSVQLIFRKK